MVPPKKYSAPINMSNGNTKKFAGGSGDQSYPRKESGDVRKENRSQQTSSGSFRTDAAISGHNRMPGERTLQRWVPDSAPTEDLSLEGGGQGASTNGRPWDQFAVNEQKFGLKTDYDDNIYTTPINKSDPNYEKRVKEANKIAREIESSTANNSHVAEERVTNNFTGNSGMDEEDKYSGVQRQQDFPPLASANRSNKYTTPARRAPTGQSTVSGAPVDPAIISSQLARPDKLPMEKGRSTPAPSQAQTSQKTDASISRPESPAKTTAAKSEIKATVPAPSSAAKAPSSQPAKKIEVPSSLTLPLNMTPAAAAGTTTVPNATATIERDLNASFKSFADQQRSNISRNRSAKAKQDKEVKLNDLKKFSQNFKLHSVVPDDLIPIIAKDPAKQREIAERSKREAEAKANEKKEIPAKVVAPVAPSSDLKNVKPSASHMAPPANIPNRQNAGRTPGFAPQGPYPVQNRNQQPPMNANQHGRPSNGAMNNKMRGPDNKFMPPQAPGAYDPRSSMGPRLPPTGPSMQNGDSRRSSGIGSQFAPKLNPNSSEFRPTTSFASNMNNVNNSVTPSPRTAGLVVQPPAASFNRRKPIPASERPSFLKEADILQRMMKVVPPPGKDYSINGGIAPPYDTAPVFKIDPNDVAPEKKMVESFSKIFEATAAALPISPAQATHATPQVPHQHQLPFHLQQGHAMPNRPSPRQQSAMHMSHPYPHPQPGHYPNHDDHRMLPSHSAQSFQSPRLQHAGMAYPSPMVQAPQIAYQPQQPGMGFAMAPGGQAPHLNRSYSGNGQNFYPTGPVGPVMNGPVMMQGPPNNGFMAPPQGMVAPGQQMQMHGSAPPQYFIPQQGAPPPMAGANGYPSPGRGGGTMMMNQGSQQGQQPVYGMSPAMSFQQPVPGGQYPQQPPGPMGNMRNGAYGPNPNFGTSPQQPMYPYPQNRGPGNNYNNGNKNYHPQQQGPHTPAQQHQIPTGPQGRPVEGGEETK